MISEEMYEVMMHIIGYGQLDSNFIDASQSCDHEVLLKLAEACVDRWGSGAINIEQLKKNMEMIE